MRQIYATVAVLFSWGLAHAGEPLPIPRALAAPTLDGRLDDACWQNAAVIRGFTVAGGASLAAKGTEALVCFDQNALYLAVRSTEPDLDKLKTLVRSRGGDVWEDDSIELWIQPAANPLDVDQFTFNAIGTQSERRTRRGLRARAHETAWQVKTGREQQAWVAELRIPAGDLGYEELRRGDVMALKIGRNDSVSSPALSSFWPAGASAASTTFGQIALESVNLLASLDLKDARTWSFGPGAEGSFEAISENGQPAIRATSNPQSGILAADLRLRPDTRYRMSAEVKAAARMMLRVRTPQPDGGARIDLPVLKSDNFAAQVTTFTTGATGRATVIINPGDAAGPVAHLIRNLSVTQVAGDSANATGPAIPIQPGDEPWVVSKLRVTDSRAVRGFVGAPVDGSLKSASWDGKTWEYPMPEAGAGVEYKYMKADGLHLTLAEDAGEAGFNAVIVRGGIRARLLRDVQKFDDPGSGQLVHEFTGGAMTSRAWFPAPVKASKVSFFDVSDGLIADCSFFRVQRGVADLKAQVVSLPQGDSPRKLDAQVPFKLEVPVTQETSLAALGLDLDLSTEQPGAIGCTISVQDPLNPRLELHGADYAVSGNGRVRIVCDFPDQVIPPGGVLSVSVTFDRPVSIGKLNLEQYQIPRQQAIVEALEHRKSVLHSLYVPISEARPWNVWNNIGDDEKYLGAQPTGDALQDRLRPWVREIVMTLNQCRALDPEGKDEIVRQYYQWMFRKIISKSPGGMPTFPTKLDHVEGVPEWASLVHQAWMQAREVPKWWMDHRLAPNGEFGGDISDDSDMYQNYAPFPMLERDGVGGQLLDAGARMAELLERENLEIGLNKRAMDPLHAYEEGLNQESLMAYWNYGDPLYIERCMVAAKSNEPLTMVTDKGHRHYRSHTLGSDDVTAPRPPQGEHGAHCLMWHPTLITAWYNRNPSAMRWLTEWGDGWLEHMKPGGYGQSVKLPEDTTKGADPMPFQGGWGMTGSVFTFLADLTGDARFVRPYNESFASGKKVTGDHFAEILQMGMLASPETMLAIEKKPWNAVLYATGDKRPMIEAMKKDIEGLQRFPHMYTAIECFTDRVFLYPAINPSIAYTGGHTTRNKLNLTYAVSWDGFGTDYAALVTSATRRHLKVLLCNLSDKELSGRATLWRLEPGEYEFSFGPDANNDDQIDHGLSRQQTLTVSKGDQVTLTLPPKVVQVFELKQISKGEEIFGRADLALAKRELRIEGASISGVVHNIGAKDVADVVVALIDEQGRTVQSKSLGRLEAPLDLQPRTMSFQFDAAPAGQGVSVVVDPENTVPEIFEGNNRVPVGR